jgi:hypothetical protein
MRDPGLERQKIDDETCECTNTVHSFTTPEFKDFLDKQGIPFEVLQTARKPFQRLITRKRRRTTQKSIARVTREGESIMLVDARIQRI